MANSIGSDLVELRTNLPRTWRWGLGTCAIALVLLAWFLVTAGAESEDRFIGAHILPSPAEVASRIGPVFGERNLMASVAASLQRVLLGFLLAIVVGVPLGILAGSWRGISAFFAPISLFGRNIPIAALIPLTIVWFGIGEYQKVMFIFVACVPFVFGSSVQAVIDVEDRYVDTARTLGATRPQTMMKVLVPLAAPSIYNSLRILFGLGFGYIMLAEVIDAQHGLGHLINLSQRRGWTADIYMILIMIGMIAYGIDRLLFFFQKGMFPYRTDLAKQ